MEIVGKIIQTLPTQYGVSKSGKSWKSQSYVLETQEQFPKKVCFKIFGEDQITNNPCKVDDIVTVKFDIESHEYNGHWFTEVRAWNVSKYSEDANLNKKETNVIRPEHKEQTQQNVNVEQEDESELPF